MTTNRNGPLSDEELDDLDKFLLSDACNDKAIDTSMLDGFLTALSIGPTTLRSYSDEGRNDPCHGGSAKQLKPCGGGQKVLH